MLLEGCEKDSGYALMWAAQHDRQITYNKIGQAWFDIHAGLAEPEDNLIFFSNFKSHDREMQTVLVMAAAIDSDMLQTDSSVLQLTSYYRQR